MTGMAAGNQGQRRGRRGGRQARREIRTDRTATMLPALKRNLPLVEPMTQEEVERIDDASMRILEEVGVVFRDPVAIEDWRKAGAEIRDDERVHFDRGLIRELIQSIPSSFTYQARDPAKNLPFGNDHALFVPMTGAPYLRDLDDKRRAPTLEDLATFHKLAHVCPALHFERASHCRADGPCRGPPPSAHHLFLDEAFRQDVHGHDHVAQERRRCARHVRHSLRCGRHGGPCCRHRELQRKFAAGLGRDYARGDARLLPPQSTGAVLTFRARRRQHPRLDSPAVAQLNAEALSALAYTQVVRKGCPAIYGHYLSTVSMASGAPMAGTPEISLMNFMIGQMARYYDVPWRTSNTLGGAKTFDAQAGYESASTLMAVMMAGANYIWHSAGWNEAGMHCSIAKFVVDAEQCAMAYRMTEGVRWDDFEEALSAVRDIGPGGHYLGHDHTQKNFQRAFFMPKLFDNNSIEQWIADGSKDITARALEEARAMLDAYEGAEARRRHRTRHCATTWPGARVKFRPSTP